MLREWLRDVGHDPAEVLPDSYGQRRTTAESNSVARTVALQEWMRFHDADPTGMSESQLEDASTALSRETG